MDAGKLRKRITIERPTVEVGAYGHRVDGWEVVANCFAEIRPVGSRERMAASQMQSGQTHVVTVRFQPKLKEASGEWRIVFKSHRNIEAWSEYYETGFFIRTFNILGLPRNLSERDNYLIFDTLEGGTDGH